jgi:hypothetical protein
MIHRAYVASREGVPALTQCGTYASADDTYENTAVTCPHCLAGLRVLTQQAAKAKARQARRAWRRR